ncbi:HAD family hydrolase [Thiocystis violascens]|uniref:phosphoglycolate phosphatase n=1 Tax=Thiocystis violascens (strain ATCC 17096 / DSM 198 / 6111) TaxID=765911 RepID=I3Y6H3_THIV6|nr:HAD hydrolase-like protein [Thiocystis violascens]AFL72591.1 putative phosphatase [Thiocystis violascens DSM 198]
MYNDEQLVILDADGTTIDAFDAIAETFARLGMDLGDLETFQKRRHLFKYLGGVKVFPKNLSRQIGKRKRGTLIATLTEVYREEAQLFPGIAALMQRLIAAPQIKVGVVTRNITDRPEETLRCLFARHGIETDALDFLVHVPLSQEKTACFRTVREQFGINPARTYACGDERKDFRAAIGSGMHPFMVSYGFENYRHLTDKAGIPEELISRTPEELCQRILHALDLEHTCCKTRLLS